MAQLNLQARQILATCEFEGWICEVLVDWPPINDQPLNFVNLFPHRKHTQRMRGTLSCKLSHLSRQQTFDDLRILLRVDPSAGPDATSHQLGEPRLDHYVRVCVAKRRDLRAHVIARLEAAALRG